MGQKVLLLLSSASEKLLVKWQGPFEIIARKEEVDWEIYIPNVGNKQYHVNLLKAWSEAPDLEQAYDTFLGVEADMDWDEERQERIKELYQQRDEGIPLSAWQTYQIDQVIGDFPDVFSEIPGQAVGVIHHIITPPGVVERSPSRPTPLALQDTTQRKVQAMLQLGVIEPSESPGRSPPVLSQMVQ